MDQPYSREYIEDLLRNLSDQEKEELRRCKQNGIFVGAILGACVQGFRHFGAKYLNFKKPTVPSSITSFVLTACLGYFYYAPVCAAKTIRPKLVKRLPSSKQQKPSTPELALPIEDYNNFQSNLNSDLDVSDSTYSHLSVDYEPTNIDGLILEDEEDTAPKPKIQTTYEDLRRRNRESYRTRIFGTDDPNQPSTQPAREKIAIPKEVPKRIRTNQYGDPLD